MKAAIALVCLVMALGLSGAYAAEKGSPSIFMNYLDLFGTTKSAKTAYYDGVETETVCMRAVHYCESQDDSASCSAASNGGTAIDTCVPYNWIMDLTCTDCHPDGYYANRGGDGVQDILNTPSPVAKCIVTEANSGKLPLPDKTGVEIYGTFTAQCLIKDEKDSCHAPGVCDDVIVQITGVDYVIDTAIMDGPSNNVPRCGGDGSRRQGGGGRAGRSKRQAADKKRDVKAAAAAYDGEYTMTPLPTTVVTGTAYVYVGSMTVTSRHHPVKFDKGWFQYTWFDPETLSAPVDSSTVSNLPRFAPDAVKFHFTNDKGAHY